MKKNNQISLIDSDNIPKETLITIISGNIDFQKKVWQKNKKEKNLSFINFKKE